MLVVTGFSWAISGPLQSKSWKKKAQTIDPATSLQIAVCPTPIPKYVNYASPTGPAVRVLQGH